MDFEVKALCWGADDTDKLGSVRALDEPCSGVKGSLPPDGWLLLKRTALRPPHGTGFRETPLWRRPSQRLCRMFYPVLYHRKPLQVGRTRTSELGVVVCPQRATFQNMETLPLPFFLIKTCCASALCSLKNDPPFKVLLIKRC